MTLVYPSFLEKFNSIFLLMIEMDIETHSPCDLFGL